MFVVNLNYTKPLDEVDRLLAQHYAWLQQYFDAGIFVAAGRKEPRTGGMVLATGVTRGELEQVLAEDPFQAAAEYDVTEVCFSKTAESFECLNG